MRPFFDEFGMSVRMRTYLQKIIVLVHVSSRCAQSRALDTEPIFHGAFEGKSRSPGLAGIDRRTVCRDDSGASVLGVQMGR